MNWPGGWKVLITFLMCVLNFVVYIASSLYVPGETSLEQDFGVSEIVATLGLSLFSMLVPTHETVPLSKMTDTSSLTSQWVRFRANAVVPYVRDSTARAQWHLCLDPLRLHSVATTNRFLGQHRHVPCLSACQWLHW
jgi:hypothetical protein